MHHQTYVFLIYSHAESRSRYNDAYLVVHEGILIGHFLVGIHLAVEGQGLITVSGQPDCQFAGALGARYIDDGRTRILGYQTSQFGVFVLVRVGMYHGVAQILSRCRRGKQLQVQVQCLLEVVADVLHYLLLGCSREAGHGDGRLAAFLFLIVADELADVQIVHPEILSPRRETVGFVYHEPDDVACQQNLFDGLRPEHFGGDVQQRNFAFQHPLDAQCPCDGVQQAVDGYGVGNAPFVEVVHLVLHQ